MSLAIRSSITGNRIFRAIVSTLKKKKGQQDFFLTYIFILCELFVPEFIIIHSIQLIHLQNISKDVYQVKNGAQIKGRIKT